MLELEEVKAYIRAGDSGEEDEEITGMLAAAIELFYSKSGKTHTADGADLFESPLARMGVKMLIAHWYDNRGVQYLGGMKNVSDIPYSVDAILGHITTSEDYIA